MICVILTYIPSSGRYEEGRRLLDEVKALISARKAKLLEMHPGCDLKELDFMLKDLEDCHNNMTTSIVWQAKGKFMQKNM